ncbi:HAMP domain-containing sensor histidine kinase [Metabacillus fastidiosus]|uniref:HAMP domain-containing sensor histidine kinase n=1 Tax=Metabacillus fastidiosus TaxID=1458 RepID=UPI002DBC3ED0|nr:HAMP domain-containing sensor histidine kinase [Metabacillus fastidiosus]MEC2075241.1 HAMP domain-containing sensor histidine kinase [Metabacillus fastidiosus]
MKIKYWLMISYFLVMLLPVLVLYFLYVSITEYDAKSDLLDYMKLSQKMDKLEPLLQDTSLYKIQPLKNYEGISKEIDSSIKITLYRYDGFKLYSSISDSSFTESFNREEIFKNLNEIKKKHRTYSVKKPVFHQNKLTGIYEITLARDNWLKNVNNRTTLLFSLFGTFFIILYIVVIMLLNRKLNHPLNKLQKEMTGFANGEKSKQKFHQSNDEIGELITHFEWMKAEIEKNQAAVLKEQKEKEFIVASLSHDLKTPLTVIRAYTESLHSGKKLDEKIRQEYTLIIFEKLDYMKKMLDDLSTYTALQSSEQKPELVEVDGEEFFEMLLSGYEEPCSGKGINLHVQSEINGIYDVNPKQMMRIIDNLMANAIRYTENDAHIWLGAISQNNALPQWVFPPFRTDLDKWRENCTMLLIQNEGEQILKEQQKHIFKPFVQAESARGPSGSSGLGLSIAKMLIEQHNGKIKLMSEDGYGTLVACLIPER